jgi:hypothetical protein
MISSRLALPLLLVSTSAYADSRAWTVGKAVIPSGAQVVGGVNAASLRASKLYETMMPMVWMQASDAKAQFDMIKADCNIDVLAAVDSIAFGVDANQAGVIVVALKGTNRKELEACAQKRGKAADKPVTITTEGKLTKYVGVTDKTMFVDWLANDVVAISTSPEDKDTSLKLLGGGVASDKALKAPLAKVKTTATMWAVYNKAEDIGTQDAPAHMSLAYGSAVFANGNIDGNVHVVLADDKEATGQVTSLTKQVADMKKAGPPAALAGIIKTLALKSDKNEVTATASLPQDDVFALVGAAMKR